MQRLLSRVFLGLFLIGSMSLTTITGCGGGSTETGAAPEEHSATVGGEHGAVSGAAGAEAPEGVQ